MSIEMADGTFTPPEIFSDELVDRFKELAENGEARALHVGTWQELEEKAETADLQAQMDELREKIEMFEKRETSLIKFPTFDDIHKYANDHKA